MSEAVNTEHFDKQSSSTPEAIFCTRVRSIFPSLNALWLAGRGGALFFETSSEARRYAVRYFLDAALIMDALSLRSDVAVDQDWIDEATTWRFIDGSSLRISGQNVEVLPCLK